MIKKTKTGFYIMGNNTYINENIVTEVGEDFVVTKYGEIYKYGDFEHSTFYVSSLYGTQRKLTIGGIERE